MAGHYDDRENVGKDILLGRRELKKMEFDYSCDEMQDLLYELYCIPSHNEYAYFVEYLNRLCTYLPEGSHWKEKEKMCLDLTEHFR